jgi:arabinose-5-phosphate isomerase
MTNSTANPMLQAPAGEETLEADLRSAKQVLHLEAEGLRALADDLGRPFGAAVDVLEKVSGRVVVSGMGKSGHVACKIAATLASTGTPAFFVHPAEASHGDLGMITNHDAIVALSNSGETVELADLVQYTKRFSIPLIAMTCQADSTLALAATVALVIPASAEACPMGLAPTTSTTVMLALGDALAVTLLERKGFSADDFQVLHPGGQLGSKLLKVSDIMHGGDRMPLIDGSTLMTDVIIEISSKSLGCVGVMAAHGGLEGIITDGDLRRHMGDGILRRTAADVMTPGLKTIRPGALASEAVRVMNADKITSLFVVENDRPVGIVHIHDCLRAGVT